MEFYEDFMESGVDYTDSSELALARDQVQMQKMVVALESAEAMHEISLREAELKCYAESGSDEDFIGYVEAANNNLEQKTDNIIKRLWKKVEDFFTKLKEKIFGTNDVNLPDDSEVHMPRVVANFLDKLAGLWSQVKAAIANAKKKLSENPAWQKFILLMATAVAAIATSAFILVTKTDKLKLDIKEKFSKDDTAMSGKKFNGIRSLLNNMTDHVKGIAKKNANSSAGDADTAKEMSKFGTHLNTLVTKVAGPFRQWKAKRKTQTA